jgi:ubiquinone/menaquinone biosynthesis C-methylase UbiE
MGRSIHGDVGCLPFADKSIDFVLSMNGFHSFPNKEIAIVEIARILKTNAKFSGCFYVSGRRKLSDIMVNASLKRSNLFAEPFYTAEDYVEMFNRYFDLSELNFCRSFFLYDAYKKNTDT